LTLTVLLDCPGEFQESQYHLITDPRNHLNCSICPIDSFYFDYATPIRSSRRMAPRSIYPFILDTRYGRD
jgi:hypothetical protein